MISLPFALAVQIVICVGSLFQSGCIFTSSHMGPRGSLGQAVVSSGISVWLHFHSSHVRPRGSLGQAVVSSGISVWLHFHSSHMRLRGSLGQAVVSSS